MDVEKISLDRVGEGETRGLLVGHSSKRYHQGNSKLFGYSIRPKSVARLLTADIKQKAQNLIVQKLRSTPVISCCVHSGHAMHIYIRSTAFWITDR